MEVGKFTVSMVQIPRLLPIRPIRLFGKFFIGEPDCEPCVRRQIHKMAVVLDSITEHTE